MLWPPPPPLFHLATDKRNIISARRSRSLPPIALILGGRRRTSLPFYLEEVLAPFHVPHGGPERGFSVEHQQSGLRELQRFLGHILLRDRGHSSLVPATRSTCMISPAVHFFFSLDCRRRRIYYLWYHLISFSPLSRPLPPAILSADY